MRTTKQIIARIKKLKNQDFFGFQRNNLLRYLTFEDAKPFLKDGTTAEQWTHHALTDDAVLEQLRSYMPFAWDKANNCRGLSASRSVDHMKTLLWLLGDPLGEKLDDIYEYYGKPCLAAVCEKYGIDWRALDNDCWTNEEGGRGKPAPAFVEVPA